MTPTTHNATIQVLSTASDITSLPSGCIFVATMGALHEGHAALIRDAAQRARGTSAPVVISIFVNPTQFNDPADYARYPKTLDADLSLAHSAGATHAFVPDVSLLYPLGMDAAKSQAAAITLPPVATQPNLEDSRRPGHFAGVYLVVWKLFELVRPSAAIFGEKDWQQLQLITAMTAEMNQRHGTSIRIIPSPTIREPDGLAMSSRNRFLTPAERAIAPAIHRIMHEARTLTFPAVAEAHMLQRLQHAGLHPEYAVVRDAATLLTPIPGIPWRILVAARLGSIRLIDNMAW
ncbi:MAG: pantoate--beta-alanine ligase [Planctomycetes bacterium]|nr:pantoate--beta-alanine ligase [Planctomycetota bacterium]